MKKKLFNLLFSESENLGLPRKDIEAAKEYFVYNEFGIALDLIVTQISEYEISIDEAFFNLVNSIAMELKLPPEEYSYIKESINHNKSAY